MSKRSTLQTRLTHVRLADLYHPGGDTMARRQGHKLWRDLGGPSTVQPLLTFPKGSPKAKKAARAEYILHLAPHRVAGIGSVCPWSTPGCRAECLYHAGRGSMVTVQTARVARTLFAYHHPAAFLHHLRHDLLGVIDRHTFDELPPLVRLNGTSDIAWELVAPIREVMGRAYQRYGAPVFADYTKASRYDRASALPYRLVRSLWPDRYNAGDVALHWAQGDSVSIVSDYAALSDLPMVVDASASDEWILSDRPVVGVLEPLNGASSFDAGALRSALSAAARAAGWETIDAGMTITAEGVTVWV